ncbi:MAG: hypothetical protein ISQ46_05210 [Methylophilaceae bacterium]|nr:hypothetical protein [Methylophilaceae bacterium]
MNEQDKILLSAYLDSDLTDSENEYVEKLLQQSHEAKLYLEALKLAKIENENFFKNSLHSKSYLQAEVYINDIEEKFSSSNSIVELFFNKKLLFSNLFTATAAFLIFLYVPVDETNILNNYTNKDLIINIPKTRDISSRSFDDIILNGLRKMIEDKSKLGVINYGAESYRIFIDRADSISNGVYCYDGDIYSKEFNTKFTFCDNNGVDSISFEFRKS